MNSVGAAKPMTRSILYASKPRKVNCVHTLLNIPIVKKNIRQT